MKPVYSIDELKQKLTPVFKKYGIMRASVFGSYARGEATGGSDVNLLIFIGEDFGLDSYVAFKHEAVETLGKDVDILEYRSIGKRMEKDILQEAVLLYEE